MADALVANHAKLVVLVGDDVRSMQTMLRGLPPHPAYAVVTVVPASADLIPALASSTALPVIAVKESVALEAAKVFVVHPHEEVEIDAASIRTGALESSGTRDRMLRSIADLFGHNAAVVVLAGHDGDGALGLKRIRETGGIVLCERVEPSTVSSLPRAAMMSGMVDVVAPLDQLPGRLATALGREPELSASDATPNDETLRDILTMIRIRTGHDFSGYKRATLFRRIARRMQVCDVMTLADYRQLLREMPTELVNLLRDFLISVTNFFRDREAFAQLDSLVIPRLFRGKTAGDQVRVWVAGCATGEEAYSLAMLLCEYASRLTDPPQLQIFATDIDEEALQEARQGFYPEEISVDVSPERLLRFFVREGGGYRVSKELRELMLFSPHNVLRDPPFSRLDLVSCRNLLIYLNRDAQERVINTFHFALRPEGWLFLGSSESVEGMQHFSPLELKSRIYERKIAPAGVFSDANVTATRWAPTRSSYPLPVHERAKIGSFGELHHRAVELYAPPSVLVNEDLEVVHMSENVGRFLEIAGGEPTRQLLRLVQTPLRFELRGALYAAKQSERGSDTRIVRFEDNGTIRTVELRVRRVNVAEAAAGTMLVMIDEIDDPRQIEAVPGEPGMQMEPLVRDLEDQLHRTREQLRTTVEQYETSLEEQKASNEELHAVNEELRSATEELETSKEELQSVNEELTTVNHELKVKIDEVSRANSDLQNLMTSTDIGVLFLDRGLHIKRFTPRMHQLFNLIPTDLGRPLAHVTHRLDVLDLSKVAERVLTDLHSTERQVVTDDGHRYFVRALPYRSIDDRIDGVVMTFVDVTDLKLAQEARIKSEQALRTSEERLTLALSAAPLAVISPRCELAADVGLRSWQTAEPADDPCARHLRRRRRRAISSDRASCVHDRGAAARRARRQDRRRSAHVRFSDRAHAGRPARHRRRERRLRHHPEQGRRTVTARRRPAQRRVPRDALARATQSTHATTRRVRRRLARPE